MKLLFTETLMLVLSVAGFTEAGPCTCDCGPSAVPPQCSPPASPVCAPPQVICAPPPPPPVCPPPMPCPIPFPPLPPLPTLPCPSLCLTPPPMFYAQNSCCVGCPAPNPCTFRSRKRREVGARAFAKATGNLSNDAICNNAILKTIIKEHLVDDVWSTKEMIEKVLLAKFPSTPYNILCAAGDLAYTAQTHDFCLAQRNNVSCYVFRPL